jgi:hypothetical protein
VSCPTREQILDLVNGEADRALEGHVRSCPACAALTDSFLATTEALARVATAAQGACLSGQELSEYLHDHNPRAEAHLSTCGSCRADLAALHEALGADVDGDAVSVPLVSRVRDLVPRAGSSPALRALGRSTRATRVTTMRRRPATIWPYAVAAAALFAAVIGFIAMGRSHEPSGDRPVVKPRAPAVERPRDLVEKPAPDVPKPEPPRPDPVVDKPEPPRPEPPRPDPVVDKPQPPKPELPKPEPPRPDPVVDKPEPPKPDPVVDKPAPPTKVEEKYVPTTVTAVRGPATSGARALSPGEVTREETIATGRLGLAAFDVGAEYTVVLRPETQIRVERRDTGAVRIGVDRGEAFFAVARREAPFEVATAHAEVLVRGTAFSVAVEGKLTVLTVSEGVVTFKNAKGSVDAKAGTRYVCDAAVKPRPAPVDAKAELAWTRRPDVTGEAAPGPWMEHYAGSSKKMPGLVVSGPYAEWEADSGRLARAVAERLESGLFLGHFHRDKKDRRIWINIDRGTEGAVAADGSLGQAVATERAKKFYEEYLAHVREAAGVGPRGAASFILTLRDHSEQAGGEELGVCEIAWFGFNKKGMVAAKAQLDKLVEKHAPKTPVVFKFDELDEEYEYKGRKVKFKFTEGDAKTSGWMTTPVCRRGLAMFFPPSFGKDASDFDTYAKIVAELAEFLYNQR